MPVISINNMTKDYGNHQGVFDINLQVNKGEVYGFVGTNGAGKTTTIRQIMGFLHSNKGTATINGKDCWKKSHEIKQSVGYIPGEIAFPDAKTGTDFLAAQANLLGLKDMSYAKKITEKLQLDTSANLKRMSKGMKQKTAIVAAFMHDPEILILDEPTTGLDPLMRAEFVDIINAEKAKGKTIFMSSHLFEEVERTCDKVAFIKEGKIISTIHTKDIRHNKIKTFKIEFSAHEDYLSFIENPLAFEEKREMQNQVIVSVNNENINTFMLLLKNCNVNFFTEKKQSLEQHFKNLF